MYCVRYTHWYREEKWQGGCFFPLFLVLFLTLSFFCCLCNIFVSSYVFNASYLYTTKIPHGKTQTEKGATEPFLVQYRNIEGNATMCICIHTSIHFEGVFVCLLKLNQPVLQWDLMLCFWITISLDLRLSFTLSYFLTYFQCLIFGIQNSFFCVCFVWFRTTEMWNILNFYIEC